MTNLASHDCLDLSSLNTLALYHFDEGEGEVLTDASAGGHRGTIHGASWVKVDELLPVIEPLTLARTGWPADAPAPAIAPFDAEQARQHQEAWAEYLDVPLEYSNSNGMTFRLIPPGEFLMGSTESERERYPQAVLKLRRANARPGGIANDELSGHDASPEANRALRGSCWSDSAVFCRSAYRNDLTPHHRIAHVRFRVVLAVDAVKQKLAQESD